MILSGFTDSTTEHPVQVRLKKVKRQDGCAMDISCTIAYTHTAHVMCIYIPTSASKNDVYVYLSQYRYMFAYMYTCIHAF